MNDKEVNETAPVIDDNEPTSTDPQPLPPEKNNEHAVSLLDPFDCQIKSPGVFRFELYEYVQRSAEPKGQRVIIWPDIDLTECSENNNHWRDFLRAYEFNLDFGPQRNQCY